MSYNSFNLWRSLCIFYVVYLTLYYVVIHPVLGIWLFTNANSPIYTFQPVYTNCLKGIVYTSSALICIGALALILVINLSLAVTQYRVEHIFVSLVLLHLLVITDVVAILLQILFWDLLATVEIISLVITLLSNIIIYNYLHEIIYSDDEEIDNSPSVKCHPRQEI